MPRRTISGRQAKTRETVLRYTAGIGILLILQAILQVSLCGVLRPFGAVPDLMIVTVLCLAFFCGQYAGAISGIAGGFFIDVLGTVGISILTPAYFFCGYVAGFLAKLNGQKNFLTYLVFLGFTLVYRAALTVTEAALHFASVNLPAVLLRTVLPEAGATALAGVLVFLPVKWFCGRLGGKTGGK